MKNKSISLLLLLTLSISSFAAWDPAKKGRDTETGASEKTMLALRAFKEIPELEPFFEQANGFALFTMSPKAEWALAAQLARVRFFKEGKS